MTLDVSDYLRVELVQSHLDVVLEKETGHGSYSDIFGRELSENISQVGVVVGNLVERFKSLCKSPIYHVSNLSTALRQ